jgi:DNA modification methylase
MCVQCHTWKGELGLEPTPELFSEHLVAILREVKRVLKHDGTLWLNLGDSYMHEKWRQKKDSERSNHVSVTQFGPPVTLLKQKDLCGIPWRVAFALQADGWYLRSDIIWHKENCTPESVKDRPTRSHEYIFLLSKSRRYFYDVDAIREPHKEVSFQRMQYSKRSNRNVGKIASSYENINSHHVLHPLGRNRRTVWVINSRGYKGEHFATFPIDIPEVCIRAGSKPGDIILDPFAGSGTTLKAAIRLGRKALGIELNKSYIKQCIAKSFNVGKSFSNFEK